MNRVPIGRIVGPFGIRGQVKVEPLSDFPERFAKGATVYLDGEPLVIARSSFHKNQFLLGFREVPDANAAEAMKWKTLEADADAELELEEGEYLTRDLLGLAVFTADGRFLGKVDAVEPYPAHDVLVVEDILIPAVRQFVKDVDLEGRRIVVELIEGMEAS